jgi:uncharacterized GH25 family protein
MTAVRVAGAVLALLAVTPVASAHYHMLFPDKSAVKTGEAVTFTYQFGHPFEHQLFDASAPKGLLVITPDGTRIDLQDRLEKISIDGADNKKVTAFRFTFTPEKRGDHVFIVASPLVKLEGEDRPLQDLVKVVLHVQTQNGWANRAADVGHGLPEPTPLTRPYGLRAGTVFQVEVEGAGLLVEVERYNVEPPKELPPDEQITRTVRTDRAGTATATLSEPGWWALTAIRDQGSVRQRGTFWVFVEATK